MKKVSMEQEFLDGIMYFDVLDLLGLGRILGSEEQDRFDDYCVDLVQRFSQLPPKERKQILTLVKDVSAYNIEVDKYLADKAKKEEDEK